MRSVDVVNTEEKRRKIILAAMKCFSEKGLQKASISDICKECQMRPSHIYYYFSGKDDIVGATFELISGKTIDRIEHMFDVDDIVSAIIKVHEFAEADRREWGVSPNLRAEFAAESARNERLADVERDYTQRLHLALVKSIEKAVADGQLDPAFGVPEFTMALHIIWTGMSGMRRDRHFDIAACTRAIGMLLKPWLLNPSDHKRLHAAG